MKQKFFLISFLLLLLTVACSNKHYTPTLDADITLVGEEFHLTWTSDMTINKDNIGKKNIDKEGFAKVFINGDETHVLEDKNGITLYLPDGEHKVNIELFKNDGKSYKVSKEFNNVGIK